jgi:hypothetical protein
VQTALPAASAETAVIDEDNAGTLEHSTGPEVRGGADHGGEAGITAPSARPAIAASPAGGAGAAIAGFGLAAA